MARKKAEFIFCDHPDCKSIFEMDTTGSFIPDGWLQVFRADEGRYRTQESWEFCSASCLSKWARLRDKALKGEPLTRSSPNPDQAELKEKIDADTMECFLEEPTADFSIQEIAELTGYNRTSIQKRVETLVAQGKVLQTIPRRGPNGSRYKINA
jgi:biotin operon repressor